MTIDSKVQFDGFWHDFFADRIASGTSPEKILAGVEMLNLQRIDGPVDLSLCVQMPHLREIIAPLGDVTVTGKAALPGIPMLRELVLSQGAFTAEDLPLVVRCPGLAKLHINGMHLPELAMLNNAAKLKDLSLHRVSGVVSAQLADLSAITALRLSDGDYGDLAELARMPRLRTLSLQAVPLADLRCLAAPKLIAFSSETRAVDESGLALLAKKAQLEEFNYPVADLSVLAGCTKLTRLRVDGSAHLDFTLVPHLPIRAIEVYSAPDEATAQAILARARETWPGLQSTGYRADWDAPRSSPTPPPPEATFAAPASPIAPRSAGLLGRLFGRGR